MMGACVAAHPQQRGCWVALALVSSKAIAQPSQGPLGQPHFVLVPSMYRSGLWQQRLPWMVLQQHEHCSFTV